MHAVQRMFRRNITEQDVRRVLERGEVVENYPDDTPYPSQLLLGWSGSRPIHVVAAYSTYDDTIIVITAYEPDEDRWSTDFQRRVR